jgi:hypothetical protein
MDSPRHGKARDQGADGIGRGVDHRDVVAVEVCDVTWAPSEDSAMAAGVRAEVLAMVVTNLLVVASMTVTELPTKLAEYTGE